MTTEVSSFFKKTQILFHSFSIYFLKLLDRDARVKKLIMLFLSNDTFLFPKSVNLI